MRLRCVDFLHNHCLVFTGWIYFYPGKNT